MVNYFSTSFTLGILGGGQLGKMLLAETRKFDVKTHVLDPSPEAPGKYGCNYFEVGNLQDFDTVYNFGKKVDVLTIEIENVNLDALYQLEQEGIKVFPSPDTLSKIQNKGTQKTFYKTHKIPTAPFRVFENKEALNEALVRKEIHYPFVWKSCVGGYDGRGVQIIRDAEDIIPLPDGSCLAEKKVAFTHELAVIVARNPSGSVEAYPVVEMEFHPEANQVEYVLCPARLPETHTKKAIEVAQKVAHAFQHVGLLAVELFLTEDGTILVNEVAPRPHNSGHYSIEASYTNQFEQHLRAVLDLPLGNTKSKVSAVMVNLVGSPNHTGPVVYKHIETLLGIPGVTPHIYGKAETRPFRKMGHITITAPDIQTARQQAEKVKHTIQVISK